MLVRILSTFIWCLCLVTVFLISEIRPNVNKSVFRTYDGSVDGSAHHFDLDVVVDSGEIMKTKVSLNLRNAQRSARAAANRGRKAAIQHGIEKYKRLLNITPQQYRHLRKALITSSCCALCHLYLDKPGGETCPLSRDMSAACPGVCCDAWGELSLCVENSRPLKYGEGVPLSCCFAAFKDRVRDLLFVLESCDK